MSEERKKVGFASWATLVVVAALVLYLLGIGPACWISSHANAGAKAVSIAYFPILWTTTDLSKMRPAGRDETLVIRYTAFLAAPGWGWAYDENRRRLQWCQHL